MATPTINNGMLSNWEAFRLAITPGAIEAYEKQYPKASESCRIGQIKFCRNSLYVTVAVLVIHLANSFFRAKSKMYVSPLLILGIAITCVLGKKLFDTTRYFQKSIKTYVEADGKQRDWEIEEQ